MCANWTVDQGAVDVFQTYTILLSSDGSNSDIEQISISECCRYNFSVIVSRVVFSNVHIGCFHFLNISALESVLHYHNDVVRQTTGPTLQFECVGEIS